MTLADDVWAQLQKCYAALQADPWNEERKFFRDKYSDERLMIGRLFESSSDPARLYAFIEFYQAYWDLNKFMKALGNPQAPKGLDFDDARMAKGIADRRKEPAEDVLKFTHFLRSAAGTNESHYDILIKKKKVRIADNVGKRVVRILDGQRIIPTEMLGIDYSKGRATFSVMLKKGAQFHPHLRPTLEYILGDEHMSRPAQGKA